MSGAVPSCATAWTANVIAMIPSMGPLGARRANLTEPGLCPVAGPPSVGLARPHDLIDGIRLR
jgi:hypothetical protein